MADSLDVSRSTLLALLAQEAESASSLEFLATCDLSDRRDAVELATEVGALAARGGAVIIGVDDHGRGTDMLDASRASQFDEANLKNVLGRYLPTSLALRVGMHEVDGQFIVLIQVGTDPDGAVIFLADGAFEDKQGKQQTAFRRGEFFVRHGTKSERPEQNDLKELVHRAVERERLWLNELHRVEEAVSEVSRVNEDEWDGDPNAIIGGFGIVTRLPTARRKLAGRLAALASVGGPDLPACRDLASGSTLVYRSGVVGQVFNAMDEIARAFEARGMG
jgi:hypothetical protein